MGDGDAPLLGDSSLDDAVYNFLDHAFYYPPGDEVYHPPDETLQDTSGDLLYREQVDFNIGNKSRYELLSTIMRMKNLLPYLKITNVLFLPVPLVEKTVTRRRWWLVRSWTSLMTSSSSAARRTWIRKASGI